MAQGTLYFFCGKMGAGKSTESKAVAARESAVLLSEDEWLSTLYPKDINTFDDYRKYSTRVKPLIYTHVANILQSGANVVMDFPANTIEQRKWFAKLANFANAESLLIYLKASDELCLSQVAKRRIEQPERAKFDTESMFHEVTRFFQEPEESEGVNIRVVSRSP